MYKNPNYINQVKIFKNIYIYVCMYILIITTVSLPLCPLKPLMMAMIIMMIIFL